MKISPPTRREFLQAGALVATAATFAPGPLWAQASSTLPPASVAWADKPMRWAQLTLVEDDPGKFDPAFWLDYFKQTRSDGVCLSGGGCVAYYPTDVPFHHRSAWLNNQDVLGDLIAGCRKLGMTVLVRTDPHATYNDAQAAHPDWIAVTADSKPRRHWASPEMWVTCALGPYNFEFMTAVHREIMQRYRPEGIFLNRWDGSGMCYCEHCRTNFKAASGFDLPRTSDPQDPVRRAYTAWWQQRLMQCLATWNEAIRETRPDACMIPNSGGGASSALDTLQIGAISPMLAADRQARSGLTPPWMMGKTAKEFRSFMGAKPIASLFSLGVEEQYRWKDSVQSDAEIRIWAIEGIANGMRPWFSKFSGTLHDRRWLKGVADLYAWAATNERYLRHETPIADVAIVYSHQTALYYPGSGTGPRARASVEDAALGWCQALVEARIPFEMMHEHQLDEAHLRPFRTLLLPNIAALSDAQCDQLRAFVARGGNLIATSETSLYDEQGTRRKDFGLADLFAVTYSGRVEGPMQNSYLSLEHDALPAHAIFRGLEDAPRTINAVTRVVVEPREPFAQTPLTLIPSYPDLPMEKVYPRGPKSTTSALYLREHAAGPTSGRVAYFPMDIDRTFWEILAEDHSKLLRNTVDWATNTPRTVEVTGPGFLDVTAWHNRDAIVLHLVNLTNPMAMKGPYRDFFPVGAQQITLRLPAAAHATTARLRVANKPAEIHRTGQALQLTVPTILDHEVVAIDL